MQIRNYENYLFFITDTDIRKSGIPEIRNSGKTEIPNSAKEWYASGSNGECVNFRQEPIDISRFTFSHS